MFSGIRKYNRIICLFFVITILLQFAGCENQRFDYSGFGMDSTYSLTLYCDEDLAQSASSRITSSLTDQERLLSTFDSTALTYKLNNRLDIGDADISELIKIINTCNKVSALCDDRYTVVCGALTRLWNVTGDEPAVPTQNELLSAVELCKSSLVSVEQGKINLLKDGVMLDFGSVGKGYACDKAAQILKEENIKSAVISFGGSILTYGTKDGENWSVDIRSPFDRKVAGTLSIDNTSFISTSGGYERFFEQNGESYHHIFDLRTGLPCESDLASVTVITDNGVLSDALSTACFIVGLEESQKLLNSFDNASAVFITKDKNVYTYRIDGSFKKQDGFEFKGEI